MSSAGNIMCERTLTRLLVLSQIREKLFDSFRWYKKTNYEQVRLWKHCNRTKKAEKLEARPV